MRHPSLLRVMWWSVRLSWSRNKRTRRRCREHILTGLESRWREYAPQTTPNGELAIVRAVWLGACLASRSLVRYPLLPQLLKHRLTWVMRLLGRNTGKAVVSAYLAWIWMAEAAVSSVLAAGTSV
ncbi:MAG: hypothetical protein C7B45_02150 [Sulfobacillus acidophilus]|uniref:Uncharacterized protein n=1 Tax=Sulfobacillus acidophilus TaxID=53633 RepID=A0A2T2WMX7_9FIRM|nr:MAG: hypothetical protein C7B45_02150 [Sulfobacillus acidophilus]